jgi:hypothetical protein
MSDSPGQIGGKRLDKARKPDLLEYGREAGEECGCRQARVFRELLRRHDRKPLKRELRAARLAEIQSGLDKAA